MVCPTINGGTFSDTRQSILLIEKQRDRVQCRPGEDQQQRRAVFTPQLCCRHQNTSSSKQIIQDRQVQPQACARLDWMHTDKKKEKKKKKKHRHQKRCDCVSSHLTQHHTLYTQVTTKKTNMESRHHGELHGSGEHPHTAQATMKKTHEQRQ